MTLCATIQVFSAIAPLTEAAPNRLWPQPWPASWPGIGVRVGWAAWAKPGRASNSASTATTGPSPFLKLAMKAVGMPATPGVTVNPADFSWSCSRAELLVSR